MMTYRYFHNSFNIPDYTTQNIVLFTDISVKTWNQRKWKEFTCQAGSRFATDLWNSWYQWRVLHANSDSSSGDIPWPRMIKHLVHSKFFLLLLLLWYSFTIHILLNRNSRQTFLYSIFYSVTIIHFESERRIAQLPLSFSASKVILHV
jgi:hypothetical protein